MNRKIGVVVIAAVLGAVLGGVLGYGPLLRYKSEGVLSMEMGPAEYKRFTELADAPATVRQMAGVVPLPGLNAQEMERLETDVGQGQWHSPIPKISKADAKDIPDVLLQPDQDARDSRDSRDNRNGSEDRQRERERKLMVYLGLRLTYTAHDATRAAQVATWLGSYFKEVAAREALRDQVFRWAADSRQFADRATERKLKYEFDIEQAQARAKALKVIVASYPEAARRESQQVVDVRKDNEKFMTPMAQLVGAESEVIGIKENLQRLDREIEQQAFAKALIDEAEAAVGKAQSGSDSVTRVSGVITQLAKTAKTDAEKEKLSSMAADVSQISARFLSQAQFVATPSVPSRPERPSPRMVIVLGALLAALLAAAFAWRGLLRQMLWEEGNNKEAT
ncbi:hypothetical protein [Rhodoferax sediminis]|uniref:Lipopolysaccharide biosynthesis protein n=1 Tax=Rhodoferax sediminis TaxID=2509614 RepID=A0A515DFD5_9BURK|nr:hypothetical protein [Rhodoferax sediminis]QDL39128.1 hypothetical protein EUB48_18830 [Rhodoferax sediminis]